MKYIKKFEEIVTKFDATEVGKPGILKQKELIIKASKIMNMTLSTYEEDRDSVVWEITKFIEKNIQNRDIEKDIDTLTDIKKELKK